MRGGEGREVRRRRRTPSTIQTSQPAADTSTLPHHDADAALIYIFRSRATAAPRSSPMPASPAALLRGGSPTPPPPPSQGGSPTAVLRRSSPPRVDPPHRAAGCRGDPPRVVHLRPHQHDREEDPRRRRRRKGRWGKGEGGSIGASHAATYPAQKQKLPHLS